MELRSRGLLELLIALSLSLRAILLDVPRLSAVETDGLAASALSSMLSPTLVTGGDSIPGLLLNPSVVLWPVATSLPVLVVAVVVVVVVVVIASSLRPVVILILLFSQGFEMLSLVLLNGAEMVLSP